MSTMNAIRSAAPKLASRVAAVAKGQQYRMLSSHGVVAVEKLRHVLEEYRQMNYAQEVPSRFTKDIVKAAVNVDQYPTQNIGIPFEGMLRVLSNIGADNRLTSNELNVIFKELGNDNGEISVAQLAQLI